MYGQPKPRTSAAMGSYAPRVQAQPLQRPTHDPAAARPKSGGGAGGGTMAGMMGSMMSDERSKEEIKKLEGANEALTKALSSKAEYPDVNAPSSGLQALGQQDPVADKVAAQNVGLQQPPQAQPMPPPPAPVAQGNGNPAFNVRGGMPDLSALDEAYKRIGAQQGS